ncbi:quercetin dioxygenase-like cupin family protein [Microbacterium keratanolyticum]|uniref:Cupin type-2 domain-containing protein n=1 Tax=Microbacterium keratanolyticum TaxID=67574 RepID=A0A9W6HSM5_9MICO|nr:cupin domain-containing protein [Microbacterium keratanolyticum]MBM7469588.1 quercetin dioxygenase-like cupin family protein [Microbacterium keratanolyticum]GLK01667.1 hypothetical protein GCM10017596_13820 [Microbacterium keratanolyticum]
MSTDTAQTVAASLQDLLDAAPVEEGRVRPHRVFDGTGVKIRMLSFDTSATLAEHRSPFPILVQVMSGRLLFRVGGDEHELLPGGIIHVPANMPHELQAREPTRAMLSILN